MSQTKKTNIIMKIVIASAIILLTLFASFGVVLMTKNNKNITGVNSESAIIGAATFSGGNGTEKSPYLIEDSTDLNQLRTDVNNGNTYANTYFELAPNKEINVGSGWIPIGYDLTHPFEGVFNGNSSIVTFTTVTNYNNYKYIGLFGVNFGVIKDLYVKCSVAAINYPLDTGGTVVYFGGITGCNGGVIDNCGNLQDLLPRRISTTSTKNRYDNPYYSSLYESHSDFTNIREGIKGSIVGGIAGCVYPAYFGQFGDDFGNYSMVSITNCKNYGSIYGNIAGGIVGSAHLGISTSNNYKTIYIANNVVDRFSSTDAYPGLLGYIVGGIIGNANRYNFIITNNTCSVEVIHVIAKERGKIGKEVLMYWNFWSGYAVAGGGIVGCNHRFADSSLNQILILENNRLNRCSTFRLDYYEDDVNNRESNTASQNGSDSLGYIMGYAVLTYKSLQFYNNTWNGSIKKDLEYYHVNMTDGIPWVMTILQRRSISVEDTLDTSSKYSIQPTDAGGIDFGYLDFKPNVTYNYYSDSSEPTVNGNIIYISTIDELYYLGSQDESYTDGKYIILQNDLTFNGEFWIPITLSDTSTFDGKGFTISNLKSEGIYGAGLFTKAGTVKNLIIKDCNIRSLGFASPLTSTLEGVKYVEYVQTSGYISGGIESAGVTFVNEDSTDTSEKPIKNLISKVKIVAAGVISGIVNNGNYISNCISNNQSCIYMNNGGRTSSQYFYQGYLTYLINADAVNNVYAYNNIILTRGYTKTGITDESLYKSYIIGNLYSTNVFNNVLLNTTDSTSPHYVTDLSPYCIKDYYSSSVWHEDYPWDTSKYVYTTSAFPNLDLREVVQLKGTKTDIVYNNGIYTYPNASDNTSNGYWKITAIASNVTSNSTDITITFDATKFTSESERYKEITMCKCDNLNISVISDKLCLINAKTTGYDSTASGDAKFPILTEINGTKLGNVVDESTGDTDGVISIQNKSFTVSNISYDNSTSTGSDTLRVQIHASDYVVLDVAGDGYNGYSDTKANNSVVDLSTYHYDTGSLKAVKYNETSISMYDSDTQTKGFPKLTRYGYTLTGYKVNSTKNTTIDGDDEQIFFVSNGKDFDYQSQQVLFIGEDNEILVNNYTTNGNWTNMSCPVVYIYPVFENRLLSYAIYLNKEEGENAFFDLTKFGEDYNLSGYGLRLIEDKYDSDGNYRSEYAWSPWYTFEKTTTLVTAKRYGYTFDGWYTELNGNNVQITDGNGNLLEVANYTYKKTTGEDAGKIVWVYSYNGSENCPNLYAKFTPITRRVYFQHTTSYDIDTSLNITDGSPLYIKMSDYGDFDTNGNESLDNGSQTAKFYTDEQCTTLFNGEILNVPSAFEFDGWYTASDTSMVSGSENGSLVLDDELIINNEVITSASKYTNGVGGFSFESLEYLDLYAHFTILTFKIELKANVNTENKNYYETIDNTYDTESVSQSDGTTSYVYALHGSNTLTDKTNSITGGYTTDNISKGLRPGYKFIGWGLEIPTYTANGELNLVKSTIIIKPNATLKEEIDDYTDADGNWTRVDDIATGITLYAHFEKDLTLSELKLASERDIDEIYRDEYKHSINASSNTQASIYADMYTMNTYNASDSGDTIYKLYSYTNANYVIEGFYLESTLTNKIWDPYTGLVKNVTGVTNAEGKWEWSTDLNGTVLYPKFVPIITINLNHNDGTTVSKYYVGENLDKLFTNISSLKGATDLAVITNYHYDYNFYIIIDSKDGYSFTGWYADSVNDVLNKSDDTKIFNNEGRVVKSNGYTEEIKILAYNNSNILGIQDSFKFLSDNAQTDADGNLFINLYPGFTVNYFQLIFVYNGEVVTNDTDNDEIYVQYGTKDVYLKNGLNYIKTDVPTLANIPDYDYRNDSEEKIDGYRLRWYTEQDGKGIQITSVDYNSNTSDIDFDYDQVFINDWTDCSKNQFILYAYVEEDVTPVRLNVVEKSSSNDGTQFFNTGTLQYITKNSIDSSSVEVVAGENEEKSVTMYFEYSTGKIYADYEKTITFEEYPTLSNFGYTFAGWFDDNNGKTNIVLGDDGFRILDSTTSSKISDGKFIYNPDGYDLYSTLVPITYKVIVDYQYDSTKTDINLYIQFRSKTFYTDNLCKVPYGNKIENGVLIDIDKEIGYDFNYWGVQGYYSDGKLVAFTETATKYSTSLKVKINVNLPESERFIGAGIFWPTSGVTITNNTLTLIAVNTPQLIKVTFNANASYDEFEEVDNVSNTAKINGAEIQNYYIEYNSYKIYDSTSKHINSENNNLIIPTKKSYKFIGWYDKEQDFNANGPIASTGNLVIDKDGKLQNVSGISDNNKWQTVNEIVLYAHFEIVYINVYLVPDDNDGVGEGKNLNSISYIKTTTEGVDPSDTDGKRYLINAYLQDPEDTTKYTELTSFSYDSTSDLYYVTIKCEQTLKFTCDTIDGDYQYIYSVGNFYFNYENKTEDYALIDNSNKEMLFNDSNKTEYYIFANVNRSTRAYGVTLEIGDLFDDSSIIKTTFDKIFKLDEENNNQIQIWIQKSTDANVKYFINYDSVNGTFSQVLDGAGNLAKFTYGDQIYLYCSLLDGDSKYSYNLISWDNNKILNEELGQTTGFDYYYYTIHADENDTEENDYIGQNVLTISAERIINIYKVLLHTGVESGSDADGDGNLDEVTLTRYIKYGTNKFYVLLNDAKAQSENYLTYLPTSNVDGDFKKGFELRGWFVDTSFIYKFAQYQGNLVELDSYNIKYDPSNIVFEPNLDKFDPRIEVIGEGSEAVTNYLCDIELYADYRARFYAIQLNLFGGSITGVTNVEGNTFYVQYNDDQLYMRSYDGNNIALVDEDGLPKYDLTYFNDLQIKKANYFFTCFVLQDGTTKIVDYIVDEHYKSFKFVNNVVIYDADMNYLSMIEEEINGKNEVRYVWTYTGTTTPIFNALYRGEGKKINLQVNNDTVYTLVMEYGTKNIYNNYFNEESGVYENYSIDNPYPETTLTASDIKNLEETLKGTDDYDNEYYLIKKDGYAFLGWDYLFDNSEDYLLNNTAKDPKMVFKFNGEYQLYIDNGLGIITKTSLIDDTVANGINYINISDTEGNWIAEGDINLQAKYTPLGYKVVFNANYTGITEGYFGDKNDNISTKTLYVKYGTSEFYESYTVIDNEIERTFAFENKTYIPIAKKDGYYLSGYSGKKPIGLVFYYDDLKNGDPTINSEINDEDIILDIIEGTYFETSDNTIFKWKYYNLTEEEIINGIILEAGYNHAVRYVTFDVESNNLTINVKQKDNDIADVSTENVTYSIQNLIGNKLYFADYDIEANPNLYIENISTEKYGYHFLGWYTTPALYNEDGDPINAIFDENGKLVPVIDENGEYVDYTGVLVIDPNAVIQKNISSYTDASGNWSRNSKFTTLYPVFYTMYYEINFADKLLTEENTDYKYSTYYFRFNTDNIYYIYVDSEGYLLYSNAYHILDQNSNKIKKENIDQVTDITKICYKFVDNINDLIDGDNSILPDITGYDFYGYQVDRNYNYQNLINKNSWDSNKFSYIETPRESQIFIYRQFAATKLQLAEYQIITQYTYNLDDGTNLTGQLNYLYSDSYDENVKFKFGIADDMYLYPVFDAKKYEIKFATTIVDDGAGNISYKYDTYYVKFNTLDFYTAEKVTIESEINAGNYDFVKEISNPDSSVTKLYYKYYPVQDISQFPPSCQSLKEFERIMSWKVNSLTPDAGEQVISLSESDILLGRFYYNGTNVPESNMFDYIESSIIGYNEDDKDYYWCYAGNVEFIPVFENKGYSITFSYVINDEKTNENIYSGDLEFEEVFRENLTYVIYNIYDDKNLYADDSRTTENRIKGLNTFDPLKIPVLSSVGYTFIGWEYETEKDGNILLFKYTDNGFVINNIAVSEYTWEFTFDITLTPVFEANYYKFKFEIADKLVNNDKKGEIFDTNTYSENFNKGTNTTELTLFYKFDTNEIYTSYVDETDGITKYEKVDLYKNPTAKQVGYDFISWMVDGDEVTTTSGEWKSYDKDSKLSNYINSDSKFIYAYENEDDMFTLTALFEAKIITILFSSTIKNDTGVSYTLTDSNKVTIKENDEDKFDFKDAIYVRYDNNELLLKDKNNEYHTNHSGLKNYPSNILTLAGYDFKGWIIEAKDINNKVQYLYTYAGGENPLVLQNLIGYTTKQNTGELLFTYSETDNYTITLYPYFEAKKFAITFDYNLDEVDESYRIKGIPESETYYIRFDTYEIFKIDADGNVIPGSYKEITKKDLNKYPDYSPNFVTGHTFMGWGSFDTGTNNEQIFNQILAYYQDGDVPGFKLGAQQSKYNYFQNVGGNYIFKHLGDLVLEAKYEIKTFDVYFIEYVQYDKENGILIPDPIKERMNIQEGEDPYIYPDDSKDFKLPTYKTYIYNGYFRNGNKSLSTAVTQIYKKSTYNYGYTLTDNLKAACENKGESFINPYYMVSTWDGSTKNLVGYFKLNQEILIGADGKPVVEFDENGSPILDKDGNPKYKYVNDIYKDFNKDINTLSQCLVNNTLIIEMVYQVNTFTVNFYERIGDGENGDKNAYSEESVYQLSDVEYGETLVEYCKRKGIVLNNLLQDIHSSIDNEVKTVSTVYTYSNKWIDESKDDFKTSTKITKNLQIFAVYSHKDRQYDIQFVDESTGSIIDISSLTQENSPFGFYITPPEGKTNIFFKVDYGKTFDFVLKIVEGYSNSVYEVVSYKTYLSEGENQQINKQTPGVNGYSIPIYSDITIMVKGIKINTYIVQFKMPNGSVISREVTHGSKVIDKPTVEVGFLQFIKYSAKTDKVTKDMEVTVKVIDLRIWTILAVVLVILSGIIAGIVKAKRKNAQKKMLQQQSASLMNSLGGLNKQTYTQANAGQSPQNTNTQNTVGNATQNVTPNNNQGTNATNMNKTNTNANPYSSSTSSNTNPYSSGSSTTGNTSSTTSNPYSSGNSGSASNPYSSGSSSNSSTNPYSNNDKK